ncbi:MAG: acyl-CoA reductase, partial [Candidatus Acidiferrales bacterium]
MTTNSMTELTHVVQSPAEISAAAAKLREAISDEEISPNEVMNVFDSWAKGLDARELDDLPGIPFLRMWLRRGTLEPIIARELGTNALHGGWTEYGRAKCKAFPLGVVGHWPAGNVEIQPILSMTCGLLGGNAALVRIPSGLADLTRLVMEKLVQSDPGERLTRRIFMAAFQHGRADLQEAMAKAVDGAMIWGGEEAVLQIRALPFPHWARIAAFGPRISVAAMDAGAWGDPGEQKAWCLRLARDVWQFDQQACSSPQVLYLEKAPGQSTAQFLSNLHHAFESENRAHPRRTIPAGLTSAICQARASWLLNDTTRQAVFPMDPDWTLLFGSGSDLPQPIQGKTLHVLEVDDLMDVISKWDGNVQTLGLGMADAKKEEDLALLAGRKGVDRIVKLGRMHVFIPPWDGVDLIRPMVRMVRH